MKIFKKIFIACASITLLTGCANKIEWKTNADKIDVFGIGFNVSYIKDNYYSLEYIEKDFQGIDIRYKTIETDDYVIKYYRNVTYVLDILDK